MRFVEPGERVHRRGDTGFVNSGTVTVEGQTALALTQPNATPRGTVYVSVSAIPEILSLQETGGQGAFLDFTDFNALFTVTALPVADISSFGTKSLQSPSLGLASRPRAPPRRPLDFAPTV